MEVMGVGDTKTVAQVETTYVGAVMVGQEELEIRRLATGALVGLDGSYLAQLDDPEEQPNNPYDEGVMVVPDDEPDVASLGQLVGSSEIVTITIQAGEVANVEGLPRGWEYAINDLDNYDACDLCDASESLVGPLTPDGDGYYLCEDCLREVDQIENGDASANS